MAGDFGPESLSLGDQPVQFFPLALKARGQFLWHASNVVRANVASRGDGFTAGGANKAGGL